MAHAAKTPVSILTGFLGSGKTTLLNALLRHPGLRDTAVIVNELGEVGLDHLLVEQAADNVVLLSNGCLCCEVLNSFRETLADLHHRCVRQELPPFRRVVAETTGMADPGPVLQTLIRDSVTGPLYCLGSVITTVDAVFGATTLAEHWEARQQLAFADRVILTKTDLTQHACPEELHALVTALNPTAHIHLADYGAATIEGVLGLAGRDGGEPDIASLFAPRMADIEQDIGAVTDAVLAAPAHTPHEHDVRSASFVIDEPITWSGLAGWIDFCREFFGNDLLRCKGIVHIKGHEAPQLVQGVRTVFSRPERLDRSGYGDRKSRLVCIYKDLDPELLRATLAILEMDDGMFRPASVAELRTLASQRDTKKLEGNQ